MKYLALFVFIFLSSCCFAKKVQINENLEISKLADDVYVYTAWSEIPGWGRVGSNGMIVIQNGKALLCDSPTEVSQTKELMDYITHSLHARVTLFVPGHWHNDCVGGMAWLQKQGVETYAHKQTNEILKSKSLPVAKYSFTDSLTLNFGKDPVKCYFLGGGHATDNIVVWLPNKKILFGGCMVKDCSSSGLGNTADAAPVSEWLATIVKTEEKFKEARVVIPGHGGYGNKQLLEHTRKLLSNALR